MNTRIFYAARSDVGCTRSNNEDNIFVNGRCLTSEELCRPFGTSGVCSAPAVFAVFDGVGGESCGECASMVAAQMLAAYESQLLSDPENGSDRMDSYAECANRRIAEVAAAKGVRMGTTAAIAAVFQNEIRAYNVGDSRIYLCTRGRLQQISEDHTLAARRVRQRAYTEDEARRSRDWGKLTACLGISKPNGEYATLTRLPITRVRSAVRLLLCSDGVSDMVPDRVMDSILRFGPPDHAGKRLMSEALNRGGRDNTSFIIVDVIPARAGISRLRYAKVGKH